VVPPGNLCLRPGDEVRITVPGVGTLVNRMR
jgi:protein involved in polysaccharide export with SLBB domain